MSNLKTILEFLGKDIEDFAINIKESNAYVYEKEFKTMMKNYCNELLQSLCFNKDTLKRDTRKVKTVYGDIKVDKSHCLSECPMNFGISPLLQEHMCRIGSKLTFSDSEEEFGEMFEIDVNAKQIERVCHKYGEVIDHIDWEQSYKDSIQLKLRYPNSDNLYCEVDGSMIFTREEGWKELKLGRIFYEEDNLEISSKRNHIISSVYCAHLGSADVFWDKFSEEIPTGKNLIFINDGARWIWNYIQDHYPNSVQILDYYHYQNHMYDFAKIWFNNNKEKTAMFVDKLSSYLFDNNVDGFFEHLYALKTNGKKKIKELEKLLTYLERNRKRISYGHFKKQGYLIGSGAIEASHREVIQKRLKLSGQRWTMKGAQQIANLRVVRKSNRWESILLPYFTNNVAA
ncbi:MAG: hypothetical protein GY756_11420 [bacterium]|nr:hypothetical protein [bacterium]